MLKTVLMLVLLTSFASSFAQASSKTELEQLISENKGKVIYLDFWASWCVPCKKSFPWMNEMQDKYKQQGLKVITVNVDVEKSFADDFLKDNNANFSVIFDPKGEIAKSFKLKGMPSSYLFNKDGQPVSAHVGFFNDKKPEYEQEIQQLLAQ